MSWPRVCRSPRFARLTATALQRVFASVPRKVLRYYIIRAVRSLSNIFSTGGFSWYGERAILNPSSFGDGDAGTYSNNSAMEMTCREKDGECRAIGRERGSCHSRPRLPRKFGSPSHVLCLDCSSGRLPLRSGALRQESDTGSGVLPLRSATLNRSCRLFSLSPSGTAACSLLFSRFPSPSPSRSLSDPLPCPLFPSDALPLCTPLLCSPSLSRSHLPPSPSLSHSPYISPTLSLALSFPPTLSLSDHLPRPLFPSHALPLSCSPSLSPSHLPPSPSLSHSHCLSLTLSLSDPLPRLSFPPTLSLSVPLSRALPPSFPAISLFL
ncbi:hypothetical protein ACLOJK_041147 [Asimina triloba]